MMSRGEFFFAVIITDSFTKKIFNPQTWKEGFYFNDSEDVSPIQNPVYSVTLSKDERTYPEIYAIAKRHGVSAEHYFAYEVQGSKALLLSTVNEILSSGDEVSSSVNSSVDFPVNVSAESDDSNLRQEYLFQSVRYANFIKWTMLLDKRTAELDAGFSFTVYTAHNYADGDDYYLFRSNAYATPRNFKHYEERANWGYTRLFDIKASVPGADTSDVILRDNAVTKDL